MVSPHQAGAALASGGRNAGRATFVGPCGGDLMGWLLVLAFLAVPVVEIYVIIQVGQVIGAWPTVALLLVESLLGAWLVKREGRRAWGVLQAAAGTGRPLTDGERRHLVQKQHITRVIESREG